MIKKSLYFHFSLIIALSTSFYFHKKIVNEFLLFDFYCLNAFVAVLVFNIAFFFIRSYTEHVLNYFLAGTAIKFILFFVVVYPSIKLAGDQSKTIFFSFFVPYLISLIVETCSLILLVKNPFISRQ